MDKAQSYGDPVYGLDADQNLEDFDLGKVPEDTLEELLNTSEEHGSLRMVDGSAGYKDKLKRFWYTVTQREDDRVLTPEGALTQETENFPPEVGLDAEEYSNLIAYQLLEKSDEAKNSSDSPLSRLYNGSKMLGAHAYSKTFGPPAAGTSGYVFAEYVQNPEIMLIPKAGVAIGAGIGIVQGAQSWYKSHRLGQEMEDQSEILNKAYEEMCKGELEVPKEIKVNQDPLFNQGLKLGHWHQEDGIWEEKYHISASKIADDIGNLFKKMLSETSRDEVEEDLVEIEHSD